MKRKYNQKTRRYLSKIFIVGSAVQLFLLSVTLSTVYCRQSSAIQNITGDWEHFERRYENYPKDTCEIIMDETILFEKTDFFLSFTDSTVAINWSDYVHYRIEQNIMNPSILIYKKQDSIKVPRYGEVMRIAVNEWDTLPFRVIGKDILEIDNHRLYRRLLSKTQVHFDSILFASEGCYGYCPIMSMMIHSDGHIFFHGGKLTEKQGYYLGVLSKSQLESILNRFQQVDFDSIDSYYEPCVDCESRSMIIYSEGKRHRIHVSGNYSEPMELSILLHYLIELYKWIDLKEVLPFELKDIEEMFPPLPSVPELKSYTS